MSNYQSLTTDELKDKKDWYEQKGWDTNAEAAKDELQSRQQQDLSQEDLSDSSTVEEKAETLYQYLQTAGKYADAGDKDTYWEMLNDVNHTLEQESGEVNQLFSDMVNSDWD